MAFYDTTDIGLNTEGDLAAQFFQLETIDINADIDLLPLRVWPAPCGVGYALVRPDCASFDAAAQDHRIGPAIDYATILELLHHEI